MREDNRTGVGLNATPLMLVIEGRVALIGDADAKRFVFLHHYCGSCVAARLRVGLFVKRPNTRRARLKSEIDL